MFLGVCVILNMPLSRVTYCVPLFQNIFTCRAQLNTPSFQISIPLLTLYSDSSRSYTTPQTDNWFSDFILLNPSWPKSFRSTRNICRRELLTWTHYAVNGMLLAHIFLRRNISLSDCKTIHTFPVLILHNIHIGV